jgi:hypothetical protein
MSLSPLFQRSFGHSRREDFLRNVTEEAACDRFCRKSPLFGKAIVLALAGFSGIPHFLEFRNGVHGPGF